MGLHDQFNECLDDLGDIGPYQVNCFACCSEISFSSSYRIKCTGENMFEITQREARIRISQY